jgi:hypothetical protein
MTAAAFYPEWGRAIAANPLAFGLFFVGIGALRVAWVLTDANRRLREWNPRYYAMLFGNRPDGAQAVGVGWGIVLILLGLFCLYRFLKP